MWHVMGLEVIGEALYAREKSRIKLLDMASKLGNNGIDSIYGDACRTIQFASDGTPMKLVKMAMIASIAIKEINGATRSEG
jgi:hypothetical protein